MSLPTVNEMSEEEMDRVLREYGLLEDGMGADEKTDLIQTLELSKISAQTEEDCRLKKDDDDVSILPSSPFLRRTATAAVASGVCLSPSDEVSPLIGGLQVAQRRRALRSPTTPGRAAHATDSRELSSRPADAPGRSSHTAVAPGGGASHGGDSSAGAARRSDPSGSDSDGGGSPAPPDSPLPTVASAADGGVSSAASSQSPPLPEPTATRVSPPPQTRHYVDHEGRRQEVVQSERAARLLTLLSDERSQEENVQRILELLALEEEQALTQSESEAWPEDILPTRSFQESSLPPPMDSNMLAFRPLSGSERGLSPAPDPPSAPAAAPVLLLRKPASPRRPAESDADPPTDGGRQHSRGHKLLQRSIGAQTAKKTHATHKLSLKLTSRQQSDESVEPEPAARPGVGSGSGEPTPALPPLPAGNGLRPTAAATRRRRGASPEAGPSSGAKQPRRLGGVGLARRSGASEEIRPAPLRVPRRARSDRAERVMVPLATVQTPSSSKRPALAGPSSASSSSLSSEDGSAAAAADSRDSTTVRTGSKPATATTAGPSPATGMTAGPSSATGMTAGPSSVIRVAPQGVATSSGAGAASVGTPLGDGAAGDAIIEVQIACPLCDAFFPKDKIEAHASLCEGADVMEIEECPSPPLRRCTTRNGRARTPRGQQRCRLCDELLDEGPEYLEHVDNCVRRRRDQADRGATPERGESRCPTNGHSWSAVSSAATVRSPTFQRISAQTNSFIDYHNQFPAASDGGPARRRATSGRRRRGRGGSRSRTRSKGRGRGRGKGRGKGRGS